MEKQQSALKFFTKRKENKIMKKIVSLLLLLSLMLCSTENVQAKGTKKTCTHKKVFNVKVHKIYFGTKYNVSCLNIKKNKNYDIFGGIDGDIHLYFKKAGKYKFKCKDCNKIVTFNVKWQNCHKNNTLTKVVETGYFYDLSKLDNIYIDNSKDNLSKVYKKYKNKGLYIGENPHANDKRVQMKFNKIGTFKVKCERCNKKIVYKAKSCVKGISSFPDWTKNKNETTIYDYVEKYGYSPIWIEKIIPSNMCTVGHRDDFSRTIFKVKKEGTATVCLTDGSKIKCTFDKNAKRKWLTPRFLPRLY